MFLPDAGNAAPVVGEAPPDRVQMTLEDHCNAILDYLRSGLESQTLGPEDMMALRAFEEGKQQILQSALGEQPQEPSPTVNSMNGPERPYGQEAGDQPMPGRAGEY